MGRVKAQAVQFFFDVTVPSAYPCVLEEAALIAASQMSSSLP